MISRHNCMKEDPIKTAFMLTIAICWHRISEPSYLYLTNSKRYNFKLSQDSNVIPLQKKKKSDQPFHSSVFRQGSWRVKKLVGFFVSTKRISSFPTSTSL